jgi:X-X-X-Leu-X-X-Gly heptad repeat protein
MALDTSPLQDWPVPSAIDAAADGAVELYDGAKDLVSGGWNAVFG